MTKRALSIQPKEDGDMVPCEHISHTRCLVQGKVCNMILDGGSCTNMKYCMTWFLWRQGIYFWATHGSLTARGIEHQIDLILGCPIPNRPAYRTNPKETKEIQKQAKELLQKDFVRESPSPCSVPVILVPKKD
ncbi:hypothetical protein CR513_03210, partial [Mucuna pruriens]